MFFTILYFVFCVLCFDFFDSCSLVLHAVPRFRFSSTKELFFSECPIIFVCSDDTLFYILILNLFIYLIHYKFTTITTNDTAGCQINANTLPGG